MIGHCIAVVSTLCPTLWSSIVVKFFALHFSLNFPNDLGMKALSDSLDKI